MITCRALETTDADPHVAESELGEHVGERGLGFLAGREPSARQLVEPRQERGGRRPSHDEDPAATVAKDAARGGDRDRGAASGRPGIAGDLLALEREAPAADRAVSAARLDGAADGRAELDQRLVERAGAVFRDPAA